MSLRLETILSRMGTMNRGNAMKESRGNQRTTAIGVPRILPRIGFS